MCFSAINLFFGQTSWTSFDAVSRTYTHNSNNDATCVSRGSASSFDFVHQLLREENGYIECMTFAEFLKYMDALSFIKEIGEGGEGRTMKFMSAAPDSIPIAVKRSTIELEDYLGNSARQQLQDKVQAVKEVEPLASQATPGSQLAVPYKLIIVPHSVEPDKFMIMEFMPYAEGSTLTNFAKTHHPQGMPEMMLQSLLVRCLPGFVRMQLADVVHRDIKGCNLQISPDGMVRFLDWGFAQRASSHQYRKGLTYTHATPESLSSYFENNNDLSQLSQPATQATDVYCFFVTMHYLLVGGDPLEFIDLVGLYNTMKVSQGNISFAGRPVSNLMREIFVNCVRLNPKDRWTWNDVVLALGSDIISQELETCRAKPAISPVLLVDLQFLLDHCRQLEGKPVERLNYSASTRSAHLPPQQSFSSAADANSFVSQQQIVSISTSPIMTNTTTSSASEQQDHAGAIAASKMPCMEVSVDCDITASDASKSDAESSSIKTAASGVETSRSWDSDSGNCSSASETPRHQDESQQSAYSANTANHSVDHTTPAAACHNGCQGSNHSASSTRIVSIGQVLNPSTKHSSPAHPPSIAASQSLQGYTPISAAVKASRRHSINQQAPGPCQSTFSRQACNKRSTTHRRHRNAGCKLSADNTHTAPPSAPTTNKHNNVTYESLMPLALVAVKKALRGL